MSGLLSEYHNYEKMTFWSHINQLQEARNLLIFVFYFTIQNVLYTKLTNKLKNRICDMGLKWLLQIWGHPGWVVSHFHSRMSSLCNVLSKLSVQNLPKNKITWFTCPNLRSTKWTVIIKACITILALIIIKKWQFFAKRYF